MAVGEPAWQVAEVGVEPVVHHDHGVVANERLHPLLLGLGNLGQWIAAVVEHVRPVGQFRLIPGVDIEEGKMFVVGRSFSAASNERITSSR